MKQYKKDRETALALVSRAWCRSQVSLVSGLCPHCQRPMVEAVDTFCTDCFDEYEK